MYIVFRSWIMFIGEEVVEMVVKLYMLEKKMVIDLKYLVLMCMFFFSLLVICLGIIWYNNEFVIFFFKFNFFVLLMRVKVYFWIILVRFFVIKIMSGYIRMIIIKKMVLIVRFLVVFFSMLFRINRILLFRFCWMFSRVFRYRVMLLNY